MWPNAAGGVWVEARHLAAETRVLGDLYLDHDPELIVPERPLGGQIDHSYVALSVPRAAVVLGQLSRHWGPAGAPGLLISDGALPYPQLGFEGRFGRFGFQAFTAELDTLASAKRYLAAQRVAYTTGRFAIALADAILYTGPNISPSLALLNPVAPLVFQWENPPTGGRSDDLLVSLQAWGRAGGLVLDGEFLLDDVDVFRRRAQRGHPCAMRSTRAPGWCVSRPGSSWRRGTSRSPPSPTAPTGPAISTSI